MGTARRDGLIGRLSPGEVGHATSYRPGETADDDKFLPVSVVVEFDPGEIVAWPSLIPEAFRLAEPALLRRHPAASIEYDYDPDEG